MAPRETFSFNCSSPPSWPQAAASADAARHAAQTAKGVNVSLLENVEIEVTLQFGERRLPLREIGELRSGSVIELDKYFRTQPNSCSGDRVVARGEVVIVDGNYGLRVTEVLYSLTRSKVRARFGRCSGCDQSICIQFKSSDLPRSMRKPCSAWNSCWVNEW